MPAARGDPGRFSCSAICAAWSEPAPGAVLHRSWRAATKDAALPAAVHLFDSGAIGDTVRDTVRIINLSDDTLGGDLDQVLRRIVEDLFAQDTHATGFNAQGLGIGLTVVKELAESHGGHVTVTSPGVGLGSEFVVTLPLRPPTTPDDLEQKPGSEHLFVEEQPPPLA